MSRSGSLIKNTAIVALGKICTQFVSFLLLPLYTTLLSAEEYGTVDLFSTYLSLVLPLATLMVEQGAFRFLVKPEEENTTKKKIVSNSLMVVLVLNSLFILLGFLLFPYYKNEYKYFLMPMLVSASLLNWSMQLARGFRKLTVYSLGSVISVGIQLLLNVLFIAGIGLGVKGMLIASAIGNICGTGFLFLRLRLSSFLDMHSFDRGLCKKMLAYSVPLIPNTLCFWIIDSSDRVIVNHFLGASANGILAVSHKFSQALQSIFYIFSVAWYEMGIAHWKDQDRDAYFSEITDTVIRGFASLCVLMLGCLPLVFSLLIRKEEYLSAYNTIPIYILAVLFNIIAGLLGVVYIAEKRTKEITKTTILAGVINVAVHLAMIKALGLFAAALSTMTAYFCVMIIRLIDIKKYLKLKIHIRHVLFIGFMLTVNGLCFFSSHMIVKILGLGFAVICVFLLNRDSCRKILGYVKRFFQQLKKHA